MWFIGTLEDIEDPLQLGRVRVRILGDHTQSKQEKRIATESLPWSYMINNNRSSSIGGIGDSPTGLLVLGSWVFGFYWDSIDKQQPVILGTFGGIPESISWKPEKDADEEGDIDTEDDQDQEEGAGAAQGGEPDDDNEQNDPVEIGFQDADEQEFPIGEYIFEQDTNRLARNSPDDHAFEIPEALVPELEKMIEEGLCPKKAKYGEEYYDKFDEAYVRKFAQGEEEKLKCDDTVVGNDQCEDQETEELKVEDKKDNTCQYFLETNNHPFTVYKFINRERFIPKCKVFADHMHREYWHEPDNPWATKYPYNKVWEGYHKKGETSVQNDGKKGVGTFVSESYGYDKSIEDYDGSDKEGIFRKQTCGIGSWGLGEEWDQTEGAQRYHRFHPSGNYYEIDNDGNETRKIYGDSFEIDIKDRNILIKGDWNVTIEGDKNELIEGDYNLQVIGDIKVDGRKNIEIHSDEDYKTHVRGEKELIVDDEYNYRLAKDRNITILGNDYIESVEAERRANKITRKGAEEMIDEAFIKYELVVHDMEMRVCTLDSDIDTWNNTNDEKTDDIRTLTEKIMTYKNSAFTQDESIGLYNGSFGNFNSEYGAYVESMTSYDGCCGHWEIHTTDFIVYYAAELLFANAALDCTPGGSGGGGGVIEMPELTDVGMATYPETDTIQKCLEKYKSCVEAAKGACSTTLKDPRTLEDFERIDWEKYHASMSSCKRSYENCVKGGEGMECPVCSPIPGIEMWSCEDYHDPNCPTDDKEYEFYNCSCECHGNKDKKEEDPWEDAEQIKP